MSSSYRISLSYFFSNNMERYCSSTFWVKIHTPFIYFKIMLKQLNYNIFLIDFIKGFQHYMVHHRSRLHSMLRKDCFTLVSLRISLAHCHRRHLHTRQSQPWLLLFKLWPSNMAARLDVANHPKNTNNHLAHHLGNLRLLRSLV